MVGKRAWGNDNQNNPPGATPFTIVLNHQSPRHIGVSLIAFKFCEFLIVAFGGNRKLLALFPQC
jgi:hypothetical protein